jgi:hypothetical protein
VSELNENQEVENQEVEKQEVTQPEPPEETVGDIMQKMSGEGLKWIVIVGFAIAYAAGIVYAEVHGLTMLQNGVKPDMRIWATLGMIAAGLCALLFPVGLKSWFIESRHRITATIFYVIDFAFLAFNSFTDFNVNNGVPLVSWAQTYVSYILPASPIILAGMITILFSLDPDVKDKVNRLTLRAAMKEKLTRKVAERAKGAHVTARVDAAAEREVEKALFELFGAVPAEGYYVMDAPKEGGGLLKSFFGYLYSRAQQVLSSATDGRSQPSPSDEPVNPNQP